MKRSMLIVFACLLATATLHADDAVLAYWDFQQVEGRVVTEKKGQFNGLLFNGPLPYVIGQDNNGPQTVIGYKSDSLAMMFNSSEQGDTKADYMSVGNADQLKLGQNDWTMTGWIKCAGFTADQTNHMFITTNAKTKGNGFSVIVLRQGHRSHGHLNVALKGPDGKEAVYLNSRTRIDDNQWHWFAIRVQNRMLSLWLDGNKQGQRDMGDIVTADPSAKLYFATRDGLRCPFNGALDDLLIYSKAMTARIDTKGDLLGGQLYENLKNGVLPDQP